VGASHRNSGLPAPSVIRPCKIATIGARHAEPIGRIGPALMAEVTAAMGAHLVG